MIYLNLKTSTMRSPEYIGSEPTARATWLSLLCYCCEQENGGVIPDCLGWKDRQWQQTCGVTLTEVQEKSPLWQWLSDDLSVGFYPLDKQAEVQAKREAGRRGGKNSGQSRREAISKAEPEASGEAQLEAQLEADLERKGKERNGIGIGKEDRKPERKKKVTAVAATSDKEWIESLVNNPAYAGISVETELGKMQAWASANGKQPSRRRFINWLNRAERPIAATGRPVQGVRKAFTPWEIKQAIEACNQQISKLKGDPANTEAIDPEIPWERRLKPELAQQAKELKARVQELTTELALLGKEATPRLRL